MPEDLVYANVGAFFAQRGFTTLVMNYRRVDSHGPNGQKMGEGAVFPSGGEDVAAVLKWVEEEFGEGEKRDVFLVGNSAGGVHASTFCLSPKFEEQRLRYSSGSGETGIALKGLINVAVPTHFEKAEEERSEVLRLYYGSLAEVKEKCVYGLLEAVKKSGKGREEVGVPPCLAVIGDFDPMGEILEPMNDFVDLWRSWDTSVELLEAEGHNHISPPMALYSGDAQGEKWGEDVVAWIKKHSS